MNKPAVCVGTFGGALTSFFPLFILGDVFKTILLASIGATVSFFVSLILGTLFKRKK